MAEVAPESNKGSFKLLGFDGQGGLQLIGGLVIGLIALYSSYDHVNFFRSTIHLNQQWGVWLIVTSLAVVAIDAQLASRSKLRAALLGLAPECSSTPPNSALVDSGWVQQSFLPVALRERLIPKKLGIISYEPVWIGPLI